LYLHKLQFADICIVQRQVTLLWDIAACLYTTFGTRRLLLMAFVLNIDHIWLSVEWKDSSET